jgi:hypothetical protein
MKNKFDCSIASLLAVMKNINQFTERPSNYESRRDR